MKIESRPGDAPSTATATDDPALAEALNPLPIDLAAGPEKVAAEAAANPPRRRFQAPVALRHRDFRLLWVGQAVSQIGTQMQTVATAWLLWQLTHSALALGLVGLFRVVPLVLFALFGGMVADAFDRRVLMFITQGTLMLLSLTMALATGAGVAAPWLIYGFMVGASIANAFDQPARTALIPSLVPREHLVNAMTLNNINFELGTIIGPAIAGFLLAAFNNASVVYWIDALSFLAVIASLALMQTRLPRPATRQLNLGAVKEGLRFVVRTPIMASTMTLDFFATLFGVSPLLMPVFADAVLHVNADGLGLLYSASAVGAVVTSIIMTFISHVERQGRVVLWSVAAYGLAGLVFGLSHNFLLSLLALAGTGAADTVSMVMRQTIRQMVTPDEIRGRMTSINMIFFVGGPQLGTLQSGSLAQLLGAGPATAVGGAAVLAVVALTTARVPSLRNYRG